MREFTLDICPIPAESALKMLEEQGILTNEYAKEYFAHPGFGAGASEEITVVIASLQEIGLDNGASLDEIFRKAGETGLGPCPPCAGLFLRLAWKDQPVSRNSVLSGTHSSPDMAVTVLSEMLEEDDAFPKGLYLRNVEGKLWLRAYVCDASYRFPADAVFAFRKAEG